MLDIDALAEYLEQKIWSSSTRRWHAELYSVSGPIHLTFVLKKLNKNCYSYRLYSEDNKCLVRGVSIKGLAAFVAPFVLRAFKEKETMEALLLLLFLQKRNCQQTELRETTYVSVIIEV